MLQPSPLPLIADATVVLAAVSPALWIAIAVAALVAAAVAVRALSRGNQLESLDERPALPDGGAPSKDVLEARAEVKAPVEIREGMSLKEIKAAKHARLSEDFHRSDAALAEKQARKGSGALTIASAAPTTDELAQTAEAADSPPRKPAKLGPILDGWDEIDLSDLGADLGALKPESSAAKEPKADSEPDTAAGDSTEVAPTEPSTVLGEATDEALPEQDAVREPAAAPESVSVLAQGLQKTKGGFVARIGRLFSGKKTLDASTVEELEELLFTADIGVRTSQRLLDAVQTRFADGDIELEQMWDVLRAETSSILGSSAGELTPNASDGPFVLLMVGVNGAGKTTTIGKLASHYVSEGKSVLMVAGDTFRAAAVTQLAEWANRVGCDIHTGQDEGDPSGVIFDGIKKGIELKVDVVLCDTAGRLQTKKPLMDELGKIVRVAAKALPGAPHETVLVIDANTGQNAIQQAQLFRDAAPLTGLILTKLDGTAKGGVVIGISEEMQLPIYHIGIGEAVTDLRPFDPDEFVEALF